MVLVNKRTLLDPVQRVEHTLDGFQPPKNCLGLLGVLDLAFMGSKLSLSGLRPSRGPLAPMGLFKTNWVETRV